MTQRDDNRGMPEERSPDRPVTIKDVAAMARVSWKTVTNVVHDRPNVAPATRERVWEAIRSLDYRPVLAGRQLRQTRMRTLSLLVPGVDNPYFAAFVGATFAAAEDRGYSVFVDHTMTRQNAELGATSSALRFAFDGLILHPILTTSDELARLARQRPLVLVGENASDAQVDWVGTDNQAAAEEVTRHVITRGRRRIAFVGAHAEPIEPHRERAEGWTRALRAAGITVPDSYRVICEGFGRAEGATATRRLLSVAPDVDAIVCFNDVMAVGALHALREAGKRVPEDVAVTGWDNLEESQYSAPTLTTIDTHVGELAATAVALLIDRIEGRSDPDTTAATIVPYQLIVRDSTL